MDTTKEFIAYCRKLLRFLTKIEDALKKNNIELAKLLVKELKEDTAKDIN